MMESLTVKGLQMQYSQQRKQQQQQQQQHQHQRENTYREPTGITGEIHPTNTNTICNSGSGSSCNSSNSSYNNSLECGKCNNGKIKKDTSTLILRTLKDNNYKDIPNGNITTITGNVGNPLMVDYHHRKTSAEIVSEAKILLESSSCNTAAAAAAMIKKNIIGNITKSGNGNCMDDVGGAGAGAGGGVGIIKSNSSSNSNNSSSNVISNSIGININNIGGARLISTRRPITPREPRRQLYGKLAPPGRPPSAFSLRYLQFENRALPSLEPIQSARRISHSSSSSMSTFDEIPFTNIRSGSIGALVDYESNVSRASSLSSSTTTTATTNADITTEIFNASEKIPNDLYRRNSESNTSTSVIKNYHNKIPLKEIHNKNINDNENENQNENDSMVFNKKYNQFHQQHHYHYPIATTMLTMRQTKSFDTQLQSTSIELSKLNEEDNGDGNENVCNDDNNDDDDDDDVDASKNDKNTNTDRNRNDNALTLKKRLARNNDLLAQSNTETLLDLLKAHSGIRECNEETVQHINAILVELYSRVKGAKGNWRGAILGGLYGLVECSSPKILLAVARVVFSLGVTGSNLTGACKLVFKVARNEINDYLFIDTDVPELLIDGLGRASPIDEPEACIYGYGAVRFLANAVQYSNANTTNHQSSSAGVHVKNSSVSSAYRQKSLAQRLARHGAVQLMVLHLQILNESGSVQKLSGPPLHALYQLSAALRALAGIPQIFTNFRLNSLCTEEIDDSYPLIKETSDEQEIQLELACPHLVKAAEISIGELEIQANIVRTLSILSENDACCECLSQFSARIGILLGPCNEITSGVPEKPLTLLSRLGYILGNIMTRFDDARTQLYENDVAIQYLLEALDLYSKQKFTIRNQMGDTVVDVLIKLVRVIANMSVNAEVGYGFGLRPRLGRTLLRLLTTVNNIKESTIDSDLEELRIATLGALHNLCFYQDNSPDNSDVYELNKSDSMCSLLSEFSIALCDTLNCGTELSRTEAARVLGNMTRNSIARETFCSNGGLKAIVQCLNSEDYELISTSSGVLVNLLGDWERRAPFRELKGPQLLDGILQKATQQEDWLLAGIVCQALWNFLIDSSNIIGSLGEKEADNIAGQLAEYLDEDRLFKGYEPDILWEQFATVATDLLEKIQMSISVGDSHNFYYSSGDE